MLSCLPTDASIFTDGRFGMTDSSSTSLFENFDCSSVSGTPMSLSECSLADKCMTNCDNAIGITCYGEQTDNLNLLYLASLERTTCMDGDVRLVGGQIDQEGRAEVCVSGNWGPICGQGFDESDAYIVCKELGQGTGCKP